MANFTKKNLPTDVPTLQAEVLRLQSLVASFETAKRDRAAAEAKQRETAEQAGSIEDLEIRVFDAKALLEGLHDGSEDLRDNRARVQAIGQLLDALVLTVKGAGNAVR